LINNLSKVESKPIDVIENRPSNQLVLRHKKGQWIIDKELEALALKKYRINGRGITFSDICKEYRCLKEKAQRRLKNECKEKIKMGKNPQFYLH
jgi:hypothetical protein